MTTITPVFFVGCAACAALSLSLLVAVTGLGRRSPKPPILKRDHRSHTVGIVLSVVEVDGAAPCINDVRVGSTVFGG